MNRLSAPLVVALWGCANLGLWLILVGFGAWTAVLAIFGCAVAVIFLVAFVVWRSVQRRPEPTWRRPRNADSSLIFAASILVAGLAWAFYWELAPVAAIPLLLALRREITMRQRSA